MLWAICFSGAIQFSLRWRAKGLGRWVATGVRGRNGWTCPGGTCSGPWPRVTCQNVATYSFATWTLAVACNGFRQRCQVDRNGAVISTKSRPVGAREVWTGACSKDREVVDALVPFERCLRDRSPIEVRAWLRSPEMTFPRGPERVASIEPKCAPAAQQAHRGLSSKHRRSKCIGGANADQFVMDFQQVTKQQPGR